jgi:hypothetical protein
MRNKITINEQDTEKIQGNSGLKLVFDSGNWDTGSGTLGQKVYYEEADVLHQYARQLGFVNDSEMIELSSANHYFYDAEEMKNVKALTSRTELNRTKDIKSFLRSLYTILQPKSHFIGYFIDDHRKNDSFQNIKDSVVNSDELSEEIENGIKSRYPFLNKIYSVLDSRTYNILSGRTMELYLRNSGFKVIDMTHLNGITYFCAQRYSSSQN